jgi:hypothetical protein
MYVAGDTGNKVAGGELPHVLSQRCWAMMRSGSSAEVAESEFTLSSKQANLPRHRSTSDPSADAAASRSLLPCRRHRAATAPPPILQTPLAKAILALALFDMEWPRGHDMLRGRSGQTKVNSWSVALESIVLL